MLTLQFVCNPEALFQMTGRPDSPALPGRSHLKLEPGGAGEGRQDRQQQVCHVLNKVYTRNYQANPIANTDIITSLLFIRQPSDFHCIC